MGVFRKSEMKRLKGGVPLLWFGSGLSCTEMSYELIGNCAEANRHRVE